MNPDARPRPVVDSTEYGLMFGWCPAACKFLNFVVAKFSLPAEIFIRVVDREFIMEELVYDVSSEGYRKPLEYMDKQRRSLLLEDEAEVFESQYCPLMKDIEFILVMRQRFGDYRRNDNSKLVLPFKALRDLASDMQLKRFDEEWTRIEELPVKQDAISMVLHDQRIRLAGIRAQLVQHLNELKAMNGDFPEETFVYEDTPADERGGFPPSRKARDWSRPEWEQWDGETRLKQPLAHHC